MTTIREQFVACCDEPSFVCVSCGDDHKCDRHDLIVILDRLAESAETVLNKHAGHSGLCCTFDAEGSRVVTIESCHCGPIPKALRAAIAQAKEVTGMTIEANTTAGLQAKVSLRRAWFEAHPSQPLPEGRDEVKRLFAAIEAEAVAADRARITAAIEGLDG